MRKVQETIMQMTTVEAVVETIVIIAKRVVVADVVTNTTISTEIRNVAAVATVEKSMAENTKGPADIVVEVGVGLVLNRMIFHPLMTARDLGQGHLPTKRRNEKSPNIDVNIIVTVAIEETTMRTITTTIEVVVGAEVVTTTVDESMIDKEEEEEEPHRCHRLLLLLHSTM